jgi:hypothetical protein
VENDNFVVDGICYIRHDGHGTNMYHTHRPMFQLIPDHESEEDLWAGAWCSYCYSGPSARGTTWAHIMERETDDNGRAGSSVSGGLVYSSELGEWSPR